MLNLFKTKKVYHSANSIPPKFIPPKEQGQQLQELDNRQEVIPVIQQVERPTSVVQGQGPGGPPRPPVGPGGPPPRPPVGPGGPPPRPPVGPGGPPPRPPVGPGGPPPRPPVGPGGPPQGPGPGTPPGPPNQNNMQPCVGKYTYLWLNNGSEFWFFVQAVTSQFVIGWRMRQGRIERGRIQINRIERFYCNR